MEGDNIGEEVLRIKGNKNRTEKMFAINNKIGLKYFKNNNDSWSILESKNNILDDEFNNSFGDKHVEGIKNISAGF